MKDYEYGFGTDGGEFWIGLATLHSHVNRPPLNYELRVDMMKWDGDVASATYNKFYITGRKTFYAIKFENFTGGAAGDSLTYLRSQRFSAEDRDKDLWARGNCAATLKSGWWFTSCQLSNLNGVYLSSSAAKRNKGLKWDSFAGAGYSLRHTEMKIRPTTTRFTWQVKREER